ncbi:pseudouridine synthase [Marinoscillum pacificum]|uniref:pseudouridine synthase n=1 Tax=Marinoscillum pacificum TaxID=392723 RepID=UPI00215799E0|nr:pseudouridine synthase [Marinoscillum pacificum]
MLEIVYRDEYLIAINKPAGLLVHRSPIAMDAEQFAVQELRNQIDQHVFPAHRLDRKTSGVLLFSLDEQTHKITQPLFAEKVITKKYLAIVRGYIDDQGTIDYPLHRDDGKLQDAVSHYQCVQRCELPVPFGKHATSRYSLVEVTPETGRMHQIRKHMAHIFHPIIADRPHGCNKQNRLFMEKWNMTQMMLHAKSLEFTHPVSKEEIKIEADLPSEFLRMMKLMHFSS